jgi:NAD(P)-dependent dehydrogenase (short-subunit alcohol dehydrogenase family)
MAVLEGKVAIVTGAGQGVGRGIALALAKAGAAVVVAGRTLAKCERTVEEIVAAGGEGLALACDVGIREQTDEVVERTVAAFGGVDVLVNNAQPFTEPAMKPLIETSLEDMQSVMQGFYGSYYLMQACFPHLTARRGTVINIGSVAATRGDMGFTAYTSAKEAIRGLSRVAAREWGPHGVSVNVICPFSESPGVEYMIRTVPGFVETLIDSTSLKRLGSSEKDVGGAVVFLASDAGSFITGQTLNVDGGIWIAP